MSPRTPIGHDLLEQLASLEVVDGPAKKLAKAVRSLKAPAKVNEALSGTWLGHPVHPLLIVVPMGSWISAVAARLARRRGRRDGRRPARGRRPRRRRSRPSRPATPTGPTPSPRRTPCAGSGSSTPPCNATATGAVRRVARRPRRRRARSRQAARARRPRLGRRRRLPRRPPHLRRGRRRQHGDVRGVPAGLDAGARRRRAGRGRDAARSTSTASRSWSPAAAAGSTRSRTRCVHRGGSLADGELVGELRRAARCTPRRFRLEDGSVEQGPAAYPQPALEARVRDGSIEVRAPQRP